MLQQAHPFGRRVQNDMKAYGLGDDVVLRPPEVREAVARHYAQSQADVERAVAARHQAGEAEAPAVAPAAGLQLFRRRSLTLLMLSAPPPHRGREGIGVSERLVRHESVRSFWLG
eukprot:339417-Pleurochrysis_carterae.AAC.1